MSETELRYVGTAARFRSRPHDIVAEQGETIAVSDEETVTLNENDEDADTETLALSEWLVRDREFEHVAREYPVLDESIPDLEAELATGDYDSLLDSLAHAERETENRKGALEAINDRKEVADTGDPSGGDEPPDDAEDADAPDNSEA